MGCHGAAGGMEVYDKCYESHDIMCYKAIFSHVP